jgi:type I restriction enzyme S subunit
MDTKKLRQKILDLAIRGKLVPQDPNDEPASVLIEKIRTEKERLIKEKKIKRDKNESYIYRSDKSYYEKFADGTVKCIDEEIPFEIPETWEWCRLGGIVQHNTGKTLDKGRNTGKLFEYITTSNIYWEGFELGSLKEMLIEENSVDRFTARKGDLLICEGGDAGRSVVWEYERTICFQNHVHRVRPYLNIKSWYIYFFLYKMYLSKEIDQYKKGVGIQSLSGDALASILLPLPPTKEQQRIVLEIKQCYNFVDIIESNQTELQQAIKNIKSKILDLAIRGKLVPQDPNDEPASVLLERIKVEHPVSKNKASKTSDNSHYTFSLPESWEWTTIGEISQHNIGKTLDKGRNSGFLYKYITTSNLYWDSFVLDNLKEMPFEENELEKYSAIKGDLLICEGGDGGRSAIWDKEYPICFQNHIHRVRPFSGIRSKYIYFFMLYSSLNGYLNYYKKGIGIQSLSGNSLSSIKLPLPPISEQDRIVKQIEEIFVSLDEIINSIKA